MSNRYAIHNVMAITNTGKVMFFLVEGRGFNRVGLDRVQVAYLIDKFNINMAISLDGGFSANAVYKIDNERKIYVQNDPQKECPDEQRMSIVESLVFCKLNQYREQANRERFLLPEDAQVNLFSDTIKNCIEFVKCY